ncbi:hypothetical protein ACFVIN_20715 [Streptomyces prasinus]|uniref:hypothetical protein n=1 Tax=Streptomyces prasinus TaxID=67345 RepID=UPI0036320FB1
MVPPPRRRPPPPPPRPSATPIYDALYAEYVKSFRSLPGDRSGEEKLGFAAFGSLPHGTGPSVGHGSGTFGGPAGGPVGGGSYGAYSAGASSARQSAGQPQWQRVPVVDRHAVGRHHTPAALPPAPRRET